MDAIHRGIQSQCKICGKPTGNKTQLKFHMLRHEEPKLKCSFCGKGFKKKCVLEAHERDHRGEKPFPCLVCGASFSSKPGLVQHMSGVHKIVGPRGGKGGWIRKGKSDDTKD